MVVAFNYPIGDTSRGIEIIKEDVECLEDFGLINDKIMDLCLRYMYLEKVVNPIDRAKTELFSSLFYSSLSHLPFHLRDKPSGWTKKLSNPFEKDFLIIPLTQSGHWILVIICFPRLANSEQTDTKRIKNESVTSSDINFKNDSKDNEGSYDDSSSGLKRKLTNFTVKCKNEPMIMLLDSFQAYKDMDRLGIADNLRLFLSTEWKRRYGTTFNFTMDNMPLIIPKVAQQLNTVDCGLYVFQFFECFFKCPIQVFTTNLKLSNQWQNGLEIESGKKREQIYQMIRDMLRKYSSPLLEKLPLRLSKSSNNGTVPFSGEGNRLGSPGPSHKESIIDLATNNSKESTTTTTVKEQNTNYLIKAKSTTNSTYNEETKILVRLTDGSKVSVEVLRSDPVSKIRQNLCVVRPEQSFRVFGWMTNYPKRDIDDESITIEEANLINSVVFQKTED